MKAWADRVTAAKYLALLVALLLVLVADPALRGAPGLAWVVRGAVIVAGVVVFADRPVRRTAWLVGVPARLVVGGASSPPTCPPPRPSGTWPRQRSSRSSSACWSAASTASGP